MRIIFILMLASIFSILAFKYADNSLGGGKLYAPYSISATEAATP